MVSLVLLFIISMYIICTCRIQYSNVAIEISKPFQKKIVIGMYDIKNVVPHCSKSSEIISLKIITRDNRKIILKETSFSEGWMEFVRWLADKCRDYQYPFEIPAKD